MGEGEIRGAASFEQIRTYGYFDWSSYSYFWGLGVQQGHELGCCVEGYECHWQEEVIISSLSIESHFFIMNFFMKDI